MVAIIFAYNIGAKIIAILILLLGVFLKYRINRNRFYRRNAGGIEEFNSYGKMRVTRLMEQLGMLLGNLMIIGGILLFAYQWCHHTDIVNKIDGRNIKVFKNSTQRKNNIIFNDYVTTLAVDNDQVLWIGSSHSLDRF